MQKTAILYNYVDYKDKKHIEEQSKALKVLSNLPDRFRVVSVGYEGSLPSEITDYGFYHYGCLKRDSYNTISNSRHLPYIKEIMDFGSTLGFDMFGYINSDILVGEEFVNSLVDCDGCFLQRYEIGNISAKDFLDKKAKIIPGGNGHVGHDGFFFSTEWWKENRDLFPDDLILGETDWDNVYKFLIESNCDSYFTARCLHHVYHNPRWNIKTVGARNNMKIWEEVRQEAI